MSAKIINQIKGYQPVTIELTFDTLQQLECFCKLYENPYDIAKKMFDRNITIAATAIDDTIDILSLEQLGAIVDKYKS